eukprot:TRINITY_DN8681_c0_g2_i1.p2 TRINITY_DN8681_c0_g2~~TRINITY_DN8681_c0_g2_i1.p2  ORF type:complete len:366 (-),score=106.23 TRINITY_DN8681_c0_g2_i1:137-1234(-)
MAQAEAEVRAWLADLELTQYAKVLIDDNGYDDLAVIRTLTAADVADMNILPGHKKKLLYAAKRIGQVKPQASGIPPTTQQQAQQQIAQGHNPPAQQQRQPQQPQASRPRQQKPPAGAYTLGATQTRRNPVNRRPVDDSIAPNLTNTGNPLNLTSAGRRDLDANAAYNQGSTLHYVRNLIKKRAGGSVNGLARTFRRLDDNHNRTLERDEFKEGMEEYGLKLSDKQLDTLIAAFDRNGDGVISVTEFMRTIAGPMNIKRRTIVEDCFDTMDRDGSGVLTIEDIKGIYKVAGNPEVLAGRKEPDEVLTDFLNTFQETSPDGRITRDEFIDYYANLSASIDDDDHFTLMMKNAWDFNKSYKAATAMHM